MALTKYKLVNTTGLRGLHYQGDFIALEAITDELAEKLAGKTHVLERLPSTEPAPQQALADITEPAPQGILADNAEQVGALPESSTTAKKKDE